MCFITCGRLFIVPFTKNFPCNAEDDYAGAFRDDFQASDKSSSKRKQEIEIVYNGAGILNIPELIDEMLRKNRQTTQPFGYTVSCKIKLLYGTPSLVGGVFSFPLPQPGFQQAVKPRSDFLIQPIHSPTAYSAEPEAIKE